MVETVEEGESWEGVEFDSLSLMSGLECYTVSEIQGIQDKKMG